MSDPTHGDQAQGGTGTAPPQMTLDQILWFSIGSNPGKMLDWAMMGSAFVAIVTAKIMADTVKYFDHYGYRGDQKLAFGIVVGTTAAWTHFAITCAQLAQYAFTDYASVVLFDIYTNTASDLIGGFFNLAAAVFYTLQVWKLSRGKVCIFIVLASINTGTFIMTLAVAITGFRAPAKLDMITLQEFRAFNQRRIPFFKAWGILALVGDTCIWVASDSYILDVGEELMALTYYLLRTLLIGTLFPPVLLCLILLASSESKTVNIGDYRRAIKYLLPSFYYLSPLHSLVARIDIRQSIEEEDETTQLTIMSPSSTTPNPKARDDYPEHGQESTIHIDPMRGKVRYPPEPPRRQYQSEESVGVGVPCKTTFGAIETFGEASQAKSSFSVPKTERRIKATSVGSEHRVPSKTTFGAIETIQEVDQKRVHPEAVLGPLRF